MFIILIMCQLVDRTIEMDLLKEIYDRDGPSMFILYGRRRTGKTRLLLESIKGRKGLYFMAVESTLDENLKVLAKRMGNFLGDDSFSRISFTGLEDLLSEFCKNAENDSILVIDEFPYLFNYRPALLSELQRFWDHGLQGKDLKLVLCGSSISMMEQKVLSRSSPLYGRRIGQWRLEPLLPGYLKEFLPSYDIEDLIRTFAVCDGIPDYLLKFHRNKSFKWNMDQNVLRKGMHLSEEGKILLLLDLRNISNYVRIMESISKGYGRMSEISISTGMDKSMLSKYIFNMMTIGYIEYNSPFGASSRNRSGRYMLSDNYMDFYFRFLHGNASELEYGNLKFDNIKSDFDRYLERSFEKLVRKIMHSTGKFKIVSSWWHKDHEIDVVALDEVNREILLGDIKWRNRQYSLNDLERFQNHITNFKLKDDYRKVLFIVSKMGFKKNVADLIDEMNIIRLDLPMIEDSILASNFDPRIIKSSD
jgi:hypothetical protein